jgi:hypothetical protein
MRALKGPGARASLGPPREGAAIESSPVSDEENFKVTDRRRRFDEAASDSASAAGGSPMPARPPVGPDPSQPEVPGEADLAAEHDPPDDPELADHPELAGAPDLQGVFVMFASSALIALGAAPDPMTGQRSIDLDQAQEAIETLMLLGVKTEGNRTESETQLLEELVYDLRARFVRLTQDG